MAAGLSKSLATLQGTSSNTLVRLVFRRFANIELVQGLDRPSRLSPVNGGYIDFDIEGCVC